MVESYEDKLEEVMRFVKMRLDGRGVRVQVRNSDDLRALIKDLDTDTKHKGGPRLSDQFLEKLETANNADRFIGKTVGSRGPVTIVRKRKVVTPSVLPQDLRERAKGKAVFRTAKDEVFATRMTFRVRGKDVTRFRDVRTGRFVGVKAVREKV